MSFAKGTKTSISTTEQQIKTMLVKAGADGVAMMEDRTRAIIAFHLNGRAIQFRLPLPARENFTRSQRGSGFQENSEATIDNLWIQASRERWRQLHLCIKAKLESVEQDIETFDDAFLAHIQTPDGETVGDKMRAGLPALFEGKPLRPLLGGPTP